MLFNILMIVGLGLVAILIGFLLLVARSHRKVPQGNALIRTGFGGAKVALDSGMFVIPILHKVETMNIKLKTINIKTQVKTKDDQLANIDTRFYVRVNKDKKYVVEVAQTIGCDRASDPEMLQELFYDKFLEAVHTIVAQLDLADLWKNHERLKNGILETIGTDLNGYVLDDMAISKIQKVPDPNLGQTVFVLLEHPEELEKGEKLIVIDKINEGKAYIVRRMLT